MNKCIKCNTELVGRFCHSCGHPVEQKRISGKFLLSEIGSVFNFDKGILYTLRELTLRPGKSIYLYIHEDRNKLVKPILFILLTSIVYTILEGIFNFNQGISSINQDDLNYSAIGGIFNWIAENYGYSNIMMAFFIALWIKILFRKQDYNYFEIIILMCYVIGMAMNIYTLFGIAGSLSGVKILQIGAFTAYLYSAWAIGQFFDGKKIMNYFKGFISYILGMIFFYACAIILGVVLDKI